jgi:hypothetical protein
MDNWKPGDIGICIKAGKLPHQSQTSKYTPPVRLHAEYNVNSVYTCGCGDVLLDIGLGLPNDKGVNCGCGAVTSPKTGIWWIASERLVKKQTKSEIESQIEEAVADENYELAQELTKKLEQ